MSSFIREKECRRMTGLGRTTRWEMERQGLFPKRRPVTDHRIGWCEAELHAWFEARAAGRPWRPDDGGAEVHEHAPPKPSHNHIDGREPSNEQEA